MSKIYRVVTTPLEPIDFEPVKELSITGIASWFAIPASEFSQEGLRGSTASQSETLGETMIRHGLIEQQEGR